jgi:mutator protein MutT
VIYNDQGQILIDRRLPDGFLGGFWEFPGGKIEPGETVEQCIEREIKEELGIDIQVKEHLITVNHDYSNLRITLTVHACYHLEGEPQTIECAEIKWVTLQEIDQYSFPQANSTIIDYLKKQQ